MDDEAFATATLEQESESSTIVFLVSNNASINKYLQRYGYKNESVYDEKRCLQLLPAVLLTILDGFGYKKPNSVNICGYKKPNSVNI